MCYNSFLWNANVFGVGLGWLISKVWPDLPKGWGTYVKELQMQPKYFYGGVLPEEARKTCGSTVKLL